MASAVDHWKNAESALGDAAACLESGLDAELPRANTLIGLAGVHAKLAEVALFLELSPGELRDEKQWREQTSGEFY